MEPSRFTGIIGVERVSPGSRHEHDMVFLQAEDAKLELRTPGKSAYQQEEFTSHIGRRVAVTGRVVDGRLLFVHTLDLLEP